MARKSKYQADEVVYFLSKRKGVKISAKQKHIEVSKRNDLGNGCWGRVDFLRNHCAFTCIIKSN